MLALAHRTQDREEVMDEMVENNFSFGNPTPQNLPSDAIVVP